MIINTIEKTHFSESEQEILRYILRLGENVEDKTTQDIAKATFTSAPLCIRIAKKLGFSGWNEFKKAFVEELRYMYSSQEVDASIPFLVTDDMFTIANNLFKLYEETIDDTRQLLKHDDLMKAMSLLRNAKYIDVYAKSLYNTQAQSFMQKMYAINKRVGVGTLSGTAMMQAAMSDEDHVAIVISYSGETSSMLRVAKKLKEKNTKMIAITSVSQSTLVRYADVSLRMSSREMLNTKIASFATNCSLTCLLDIIYAGIFSFNYDENLDYKLTIAKEIDDNYSEYEFIDEEG